MEELEIGFQGTEPTYAHEGDAGGDLRVAQVGFTLAPGESKFVHLGFACAIPEGYVGFLFPRSGLGMKFDVGQTNSVGVIDSSYRGEVCAKLINHGKEPYTVSMNDRVAQIVICPFVKPKWVHVDSFDETDRGENGFGSSGVN